MSFGRLLIGAILVGIGGILLASQLGYLPAGVMPWFLQFWPALLVLFGLALLANAMKNLFLGWLTAILALAAIAFGGWWLAHNKAAAGTAHLSRHPMGRPAVETLTIRARTFGGRLSIGAAPGGRGAAGDSAARANARTFEVSIRGVGEKDAKHAWNVAGRTAEFVWPLHVLVPNTAPFGAELTLQAPERTPVRLRTETVLSGADIDLTKLRPESCELNVMSGAVRLHVGSASPQKIRIRGMLGAVEVDLPASGPVRVEFLSPFTARSLPDDFLEHVGGRGKAKIWVSEGKGVPLVIEVDGALLYVKIKRAPVSAGG
ncbi:MAG TPA: DUF5668 domain-containing protein [Candidatus Eisenbacteria bacterium]|nr:DUF5668 domain-containing protein [Candidatus Eisenbacteria bacterium]